MARSERINFPGLSGVKLAGRLEEPDDPPRAVALFVHCFSCAKDAAAANRISRALTERGIAVVRFDFTGLGHTGGDVGNSDFSANIGDLLRAADHLRDTYAAPAILVGHSLGGAAVLSAAPQIPEAQAVVTIGAPADPTHLSHLLTEPDSKVTAAGDTKMRMAGRSFRIRQDLLEDLDASTGSQAARITGLGVPLLILHAPKDEVIGIDSARIIYEAARHPKSFVSLDGADHLLSEQSDTAFVADLIATWSGRYLDDAARPVETAVRMVR